MTAPRRMVSDRPPPSRSQLQLSTTAGDATSPHAPDPLIGLVVAERYRILDLLGRGGMGVVYRVEHVRIGKLLAMKLLAGELSRNPEAVRRFKHEAQTASKLSSPNTVQVFDFGAADGLTYLVMELVSGEDLGTVLRQEEALDARRLCRIVLQIGNSLAEAHHHGIVHRDVKPENVMLVRGKEGQEVVKVFDFGLAKLREAAGGEGPALTTPGLIMGTPYFMAPEQVRGESVDARADIYALGAVMYRALTGRFPFDGPSPIAVCAKHLTEEAIHPVEVAPERALPRELGDVVMRALAKDPAARFQRIEELQAAVAGVLSGLDGGELMPFDSAAIRAMTADGPGVVLAGAEPAALATRDEVEAYERSLRRKRWGVLAGLAFVPVALAASVFAYVSRPTDPFDGFEREPNEEPAQANPLPYGSTLRGVLGRRSSPTKSDVDLVAFDVPAGAGPSRLSLTALPNIPLCVQIFRRGQANKLAQFCPGAPGVDLELAAVSLEPGPHLAAVLQDLDARGGPRVFVHENVSDSWALSVGPAKDVDGVEVEPNDALPSASSLSVGESLTGAIATAGDEDVVCVAGEAEAVTLVVEDGPRSAGVVLEATPVVGGEARPSRRIHGRDVAQTDTDVRSPWELSLPPGAARCVALRLGFDPKVPDAAHAAKLGAPERWRIAARRGP